MRLIDADALKKELNNERYFVGKTCYINVFPAIDHQPTIEPDPDTISRQAVLDAVASASQMAWDTLAVDDVRIVILSDAENAIKALPPSPSPSRPQEPQWIPCSKELPERNYVVLVTTRWGEVTEGVKLSGDAWFIGRGEENAFDSDILAWMEKPQRYEGR